VVVAVVLVIVMKERSCTRRANLATSQPTGMNKVRSELQHQGVGIPSPAPPFLAVMS